MHDGCSPAHSDFPRHCRSGLDAPDIPVAFREALRIVYGGTMIYAGRYTQARAEEALRAGWTDLVGFGCPFIANPDLPWRLEHGAALNPVREEYYYGGTGIGLTGYPFTPTHEGRDA